MDCSLAITTYQAGKVIFLSADDQGRIVQLPRSFDRAMGIAVMGQKMAVATRDAVIVLANAPGLAPGYPRKPNCYDAMYMPRATYYTGQVDLHDLQWGDGKLWAVNTSFSCIAQISEDYSWVPYWQPPFIDALASEDRCHLNGLAVDKGLPRYVTALGTGNAPESWRKQLPGGGVLLDLLRQEPLLENLAMPHSPRLHRGELYLLLSASSQLVRVDREKGTYEIVFQLAGFLRGMALHGEYAFIGVSKLRNSASFLRDLDLHQDTNEAGIEVVHLPSGRWVGDLKYASGVSEIYDVCVLPGTKRPGILNPESDVHSLGLALPDATFWARWEAQNSQK
jgi:uncharacterized protein (TIGR03032 family)